MKTIEPISLWENGQSKEATILNAYAINVTLNSSATFWYGLFSSNEDGGQGVQLAQGNITMSGDDYAAWHEDSIAWEYIANSLNLVITGDYVAPVVTPEVVTPEVTEPTSAEVIVEPAAPVISEPNA